MARAKTGNKDLPEGHEDDVLWETACLKEFIRKADASSAGASVPASAAPVVSVKMECSNSLGVQLNKFFGGIVDL